MSHLIAGSGALMVLIVAACSSPTGADLTGTYVQTRDDVRATITLNGDGTYIERVERARAPVELLHGAWRYYPDDRIVSLEDAVYPWSNPLGEQLARGRWILTVQRRAKGFQLLDSPDDGYVFEKDSGKSH